MRTNTPPANDQAARTIFLPYATARQDLERLGRAVESITRRPNGYDAVLRDRPPQA